MKKSGMLLAVGGVSWTARGQQPAKRTLHPPTVEGCLGLCLCPMVPGHKTAHPEPADAHIVTIAACCMKLAENASLTILSHILAMTTGGSLNLGLPLA